MTTDVEPRLRDLFDRLADQTTITSNVERAPRPVRRQRRPWSYSLAAAATLVLVAGAVVINVRRDTTSNSSVDGQPVGLFPTGDGDRVVALGYTSPADVVVAYLADRLGELGALSGITVSMWRPTLLEQDRTIVQFHIWEQDSSGTTGEALVERVTGRDGETGWVVTAAMIRPGDLQHISFVDGTIDGEFASRDPGTRIVTVHDAVTGEQLASEDLAGHREEVIDEWGESKLIDEFSLAGIEAPLVTVRAWNPAETGASSLPGEYAEVMVAAGQSHDHGLENTLHSTAVEPFAGPFDDDAASVLDRLDDGEPITVIDNDEVTIRLRAAADGGYCVDIASGSREERGDPHCRMQNPRQMPPLAVLSTVPHDVIDGLMITVGMVPDSVATVTDAAGRPVHLEDNVFYDIGPDTQDTYVLSSADGTETQVIRDGWLTVSLGHEPIFDEGWD